ncbi:DinB family protein [Cohnella candidum]|uniref:DinB family protein n=1 Tax=Cohnella candidum TaxID=2674991 RepID=A0A3G3JYX0_9BACL|nr:DinB family protein [Cohnella candidum]AYQ73444.1 DinB family protein [Cohnella candidum]
MSAGPADITAYLKTYNQLQEAIEGLSEEELRFKPGPGKWSVTEVIAHLADHNIVVSFRIREILSGSEARLPAFSQDPWIDGQKANEGKAEDFLNVFRALLVHNGQLFVRLTEEEWSKSSVNFRGETVTLSAVVQGFIDHVQRHLGQIDRIKKGISDQPPLGASCAV